MAKYRPFHIRLLVFLGRTLLTTNECAEKGLSINTVGKVEVHDYVFRVIFDVTPRLPSLDMVAISQAPSSQESNPNSLFANFATGLGDLWVLTTMTAAVEDQLLLFLRTLLHKKVTKMGGFNSSGGVLILFKSQPP